VLTHEPRDPEGLRQLNTKWILSLSCPDEWAGPVG